MTEPLPKLGALPWKPRRGLHMVSEFDRWDVPTSGLLRSWRGKYYLFRCLDGAASQFSVWAYAEVGRKRARSLLKLEGAALRQATVHALVSSARVCALAEEDAGIIYRGPCRLEYAGDKPRLAPESARKVQEDIEGEAEAVRGMKVLAV